MLNMCLRRDEFAEVLITVQVDRKCWVGTITETFYGTLISNLFVPPSNFFWTQNRGEHVITVAYLSPLMRRSEETLAAPVKPRRSFGLDQGVSGGA